MNENERDELWDLLGRARQPEISPFFARNVVREVRQSAADSKRALEESWLRQLLGVFRPGAFSGFRFTAVFAALFAVVAVLSVSQLSRNARPTDDSAPMEVVTVSDDTSDIGDADLPVVTELDDLIANQNPDSDDDVWTDADPSL